jgi:hypothetical protein
MMYDALTARTMGNGRLRECEHRFSRVTIRFQALAWRGGSISSYVSPNRRTTSITASRTALS